MNRRDWTPTRGRSSASRVGCASASVFATLLVAPANALAAKGLVLTPDPQILVALLAFFVILIFPVNSMIVRPILKVLDERTARIEGQQVHADQLVAEAEEVMNRYRESVREAREGSESDRQHRIGEARSEQGAVTAEAKSEADAEIARAREEIAASLEEARASLQNASRDLAKIAAERILGRELA